MPKDTSTGGGEKLEERRARVLVVDDDQAVLRATARQLRDRFDVTTAGGAAEARRLLARDAFDALITDNDMPGESGLDLLSATRALAPSVKRLLVSGGRPSEIEAYEGSGVVQRFLPKPTAEADLVAALCALGLSG